MMCKFVIGRKLVAYLLIFIIKIQKNSGLSKISKIEFKELFEI
jgi:hypothetical protein